MSLSDYAENAALDYLRGLGTYIQLHTANPGEAGTNAPSLNTARLIVAFGAASGGVCSWAGTATWSLWPGAANGETITHFSIWTSGTPGAGNCLGSGALSPSWQMFTGESFKLTALTWALD